MAVARPHIEEALAMADRETLRDQR